MRYIGVRSCQWELAGARGANGGPYQAASTEQAILLKQRPLTPTGSKTLSSLQLAIAKALGFAIAYGYNATGPH